MLKQNSAQANMECLLLPANIESPCTAWLTQFLAFRICNNFAFAAGVVPEQTCEVQETRKASTEGNGADGNTHLQRHHAEYVPNGEQGVPTLRASQHYKHYEQIPSGKVLTSLGQVFNAQR
jgi:hypothetical protein